MIDNKSHSPHDVLYGPLDIPSYCWGIIDSPEFQRLRHIKQLGPVEYVFPGANHSRFEHSLGCAHLASRMMAHFMISQPELKLTEIHAQIVVIGALCHDLGHGPFSHLFESVISSNYPNWCHEEMSTKIMEFIIEKYKIDIPQDVIKAARHVILGEEYKDYPTFLFSIVANHRNDIDIDKFDYISRDINRTLNLSHFEFDRLLINCRISEGKLSWRLSEIPTIERMFYARNDMHMRVYKHRVVLSIGCMIADILRSVADQLNLDEILEDPAIFCLYDDRIMYDVERGKFGQEAKQLALDISRRKLYKLVGEVRIHPENYHGRMYSQNPPSKIADDILELMSSDQNQIFRVVPMKFRYGIGSRHPLLDVPFFKPGDNRIIYLQPDDISCIVPAYFVETAMRIYIIDPSKYNEAKDAFNKWRQSSLFQ